MAATTLVSPSGSHSVSCSGGAGSGCTPSSRLAASSPAADSVAARYSDHAPPRSGRSTRMRKDGMTLRNSTRARSATIRASERGDARSRSRRLS